MIRPRGSAVRLVTTAESAPYFSSATLLNSFSATKSKSNGPPRVSVYIGPSFLQSVTRVLSPRISWISARFLGMEAQAATAAVRTTMLTFLIKISAPCCPTYVGTWCHVHCMTTSPLAYLLTVSLGWADSSFVCPRCFESGWAQKRAHPGFPWFLTWNNPLTAALFYISRNRSSHFA